MTKPKWLDWARELQSIAQNGLAYVKDPFDAERYQALQRVAAEIVESHSEADLSHVLKLFTGEEGYATPKVDVRAAVFTDDGILLVRERQDGLWTLPGGWVDVGESPSEAVVKEVREESGYEVEARKLAMLYDRDRHDHPPLQYHVYKLFFLCELIGGKVSESMETDGAGFFPPDNLPDLSLTRVTPAEIARLSEHRANPDWPTDFD